MHCPYINTKILWLLRNLFILHFQELIAYLSCVAVHFSHISSVISSSARLPEFVDLVIDLFLLSASIYRPYNDNVRRQFHNDLIK